MKIIVILMLITVTFALHVPSSITQENIEIEDDIEEKRDRKSQEIQRRKQIEEERRRQEEERRKQEERRRKEEEKRRKEEEERRRKEKERQEKERQKQEKERLKQEEERRKQEKERQKQEKERQKLEEERRKQIQKERKKQEEERRKQEENRRKEEEKRRKEEEKRRKEEAERQRKERERQEKERRKQEEERRKQEDKRRKQEEERRKQEEKRRKAEQWDREYQDLKRKNANNEEFWTMEKDKKEKNYPKELKEKYERGEEIKPEEEDKFENEFGRYKSRDGTNVIDLLAAINRGNDVENLDEGDMLKNAPTEKIRNLHKNQQYCKQKENKKKYICKNAHKVGKRDAEEAWVRKKRDGVRDRVYLWLDRIVPYEIDSTLEESRDTIETSLKMISDVTCITFVKHSKSDYNWIKFVKKTGCWSAVGRQFWIGGYQEISLGTNCMYTGIIMHEVLHALGFFHEQSRPDRDQYVEIFWENIQPSQQHNFIKYKHDAADLLHAPYDYSSIMHYGKYSFALDAKMPTIESINNKAEPLGQRTSLSPTDIFQINELYNCKNTESGWSDWSSFGPCDSQCDKKRDRFCMDPKDRTSCLNPTSTTMLSWGIDEQKVKCSYAECNAPVDGHWNKWGSWGECSVTCDKGTHLRQRDCTDPPPANGGNNCVGLRIESRECIKKSCDSGPYDCTFDIDSENTCTWTQDTSDNFDWIRNTGGTPSSSTGPSADHTSGTGFYLYMESSSPAQNGWKTRLLSPTVPAKGGEKRCMKLAYNMYGLSTGTLRVFVKDLTTGQQQNVIEKTGDQLKEWHVASFDVSSINDFKVAIEAERAEGFQGDIAIDDIEIKTVSCAKINGSIVEPEIKIPTVSSVGCYRDVGYIDGKRPFPEYKDFRHEIVWSDYMQSLNETVLKCAAFAREHSYEYFGIEYYGECWTGPTSEINYGRDGEATDCFPEPSHNLGPYLVGADYTIMVYRWINTQSSRSSMD